MRTVLATCLLLLNVHVNAASLPPYRVVEPISGTLSSTGSDTLANLVTLWGEAFQRAHPEVVMQIQAVGSSAAPTALSEGTASIGPMSRPMQLGERAVFENRFGYQPTAVPVAMDALAIFVHRDNPLKSLELEQVDAVFSANRRCGSAADLKRWGDLGLTGSWSSRPIEAFGRNSVSGTYGFFKKSALCGGDFKASVHEQPGSASVVQAVSVSLRGIGYSGVGYRTASVRAVPLRLEADGELIAATAENALSGKYPLARRLFLYVNKAPSEPLQPIVREFLKLVLSADGQQIAARDGYIPLPADVILRIRQELQL
ncbi:MAG: phosphate ABC transporter substrate-binding protein PstS family protein [Pseudomonadota bacterium]